MFGKEKKETLQFTEDEIRHSMNDQMLMRGSNMNIGTEDGGSELGESQRSGQAADELAPNVYMELSDRYE